mmetsp:Transcript_156028/g.500370  ORF Transcript_156028/g.500370 Transcript_156028/m.500370 type:complete len:525 (-) Transcript_156028:92-1666(-)
MSRGPSVAMPNFDLGDELRATAARRRRPADVEGGGFETGLSAELGPLRGEGVGGIAARLVTMFPCLPQDTIKAVLSELFRADPSCSREQLADRAVLALLQMTLQDRTPQNVTSFAPRFFAAAEDAGAALLELAAAPAAAGRHGPSADQALRRFDAGTADSATAAAPGAAGDGDGRFDEALDTQLANMLALSDDELATCARTLLSIFDRIVAEPSNAKVRRLRLSNAKVAAAVGRHPFALELLRLAGFAADEGEHGEDHALAFFEDPAASTCFSRVREALQNLWDACLELADLASTAASSSSSSSSALAHSAAPLRPAAVARPDLQRQRSRIAELTEQRLKDPRAFRAEAERRGAANRAVGGPLPKPSGGSEAGNFSSATPSRRAQHFTLDDIGRMRVADEIATTPSYAEEYRKSAHSSPARDYGSLVARIAAQHAASMASGQAPFSHDGFNARVAAYPVPYRLAAENLALNKGVAEVAQAAVDGWIKSPGHEKNLSGTFDLCGIGAARSPDGTFYLTQLFALTR